MATSVHWAAFELSGENRRIAFALFIALLLHGPLLIPPGTWLFGAAGETTAPEMELLVELVQGESAPEVVPPPQEELVAAIEEQPAEDFVEVAVEEPHETKPEELRALAEVPVEAVGESVADAEQLTAAPDIKIKGGLLELPDAVVADVGEPVLDEPVRAEAELTREPEVAPQPAPQVEEVVATVAAAQERVLTRVLEREAYELLESRDLERNLSFESGGREFNASLKRQPAIDGTDIERMTIDVTTEQDGERMQTSLQMKRLAFSHFTQLIDRWDERVQLHDDVIAGRFHSNTAINIGYDRDASPLMLGKVTSTRGVRMVGDDRWRPLTRKMFVGGRPSRTRRVDLPWVDLAVRAYASRNADVHTLVGETLVVFRADGAFATIDPTTGEQTQRRLVPGKPTYILGARDADVCVRGVVNGNVTVYSPTRIMIQGDLTYVHGTAPTDDADSYLGLVSDGTVEIDGSKVTGPGDLDVHAGVYARQRFVVNDTRARRAGTLLLYGSLTAGSLTHTEPRYATRIEFDPRFERQRPPGFPATDRYEVESWDRQWRTAEGRAAEADGSRQ